MCYTVQLFQMKLKCADQEPHDVAQRRGRYRIGDSVYGAKFVFGNSVMDVCIFGANGIISSEGIQVGEQ